MERFEFLLWLRVEEWDGTNFVLAVIFILGLHESLIQHYGGVMGSFYNEST